MEPIVSICCITYNHEKYIAQALDSLLMQETTFPFEIIVHDDASTDKTAEIIRDYEKKYPNIVKPIYQTENQFSKGKEIISECVLPHIKGEFIAFCEGDDFWKDNNKIQIQIEYLVENNEYSACFHGVEVVSVDNYPVGRYLGPRGCGDGDYSMKDNIKGGFVHISSLAIRTSLLSTGIPEWVMKSRHADYAFALMVSANGKVHFIDKIMSSHRVGVENSLMTKIRKNYSKENEIKYHSQRIETLTRANDFYNLKFNDEIKFVIADSETKILLLKNDFSQLFNKRYRSYFHEKGLIYIIKFVMLTKMPRIARNIAAIKWKLNIYKNKLGRD